ncbi:MAG: hypothetical protein JNN30_01550 [Rhodanobacteraceae bacterium]|nr:hypothetical protein [Rhodanobacteraceae bacterium]
MGAVLFRLPRIRHPLLRALSVLVGVAVAGLALVFGLFILLGVAVIGAAIWGTRQLSKGSPPTSSNTTYRPTAQQATRPAPAGVIEGEFVVVQDPVSPTR